MIELICIYDIYMLSLQKIFWHEYSIYFIDTTIAP